MLLIPVLFFGCADPVTMDERTAIRQVMHAQEEAWDKGDIDGFMKGYSDTICFIGRNGMTCGKDKVSANYQEAYPDRSAMGDLTFGLHEIVLSEDATAWVTGTWELQRGTDTLDGGFSLLWVKEKDGWLIARDHSY